MASAYFDYRRCIVLVWLFVCFGVWYGLLDYFVVWFAVCFICLGLSCLFSDVLLMLVCGFVWIYGRFWSLFTLFVCFVVFGGLVLVWLIVTCLLV